MCGLRPGSDIGIYEGNRIVSTLLRIGKLSTLGTLLVGFALAAPAMAQSLDSTDGGDNCRAVAGQAEIDGTMQQTVGRACLQSDGTWQFVEGPDGNVMTYPVTAYPYSDPWYSGPPLFIGANFVFIDGFHHFHHFDHFRQADHGHFNHFEGRAGGDFHEGGHGFGGMHGR
jgi:surface antigen